MTERITETRELEDAAFAFLQHIQRQLEQEPGWMQYEFYTPEIDMHLYNRLSEALGSKDHQKSSELLERWHAAFVCQGLTHE